jgi:5-methylcytosine-specific restriction enzyme A
MFRAPKTCADCKQPAVRGSRFCAAHATSNSSLRAAQDNRALRWWDKWYDTAHWATLRGMVIARDPVCKACKRSRSTVADHIRPHRGDWNLFCDLNNLQGLCASCHGQKTAREDGGFGNPTA